MNKGNIAAVLGVVVGVPVLYKLIMYLITDYNLPPVVLSLVIVYVVLVYPQYTALFGLKIVEAKMEDDYDMPKADKSNWILFWNDFNLAKYYGSDTTFKLLINWIFKLSIPTLILSVLYVNLLVVFVDLGVTATVFIRYMILVSLAVYVITKTFILAHFIVMFKGIVPALFSPLQPMGFMFLTWSIKHYLENMDDEKAENTMGLNYE